MNNKKTRISTGQFYASNNQEVVRVISYKAPTVRYAHTSYDGAICKTTDAAFIENYQHISEERATELLRGSIALAAEHGYEPPPKLTVILEGVVEEAWRSGEAHLKREALADLELEKLVVKCVFQSCDPHRVFRYADNLNDANRIIERMRTEKNLVVRIDNGLDGTWEVTFYDPRPGGEQFYAPENTLARAICVAGLKAVNGQDTQPQPEPVEAQ